MEFFGSTNLSRKGIHHNWEVSGVVFFDESDAASIQAREDSKKRFLKLWDHESFGVDTRFVAARWLAHDSAGSRWLAKTPAGERTAQMPHMRRRVMRTVLRHIQQFDGESADWLQRQLREAPAAVRAADLARQGMAPGYATLIAVEETLGTEKFYDELGRLPSIQKLNALARGA
ncbi:MAG: hypothetical protein HY319_09350, partial [Armatimonadetes bacterium]|nr:hypothetical protein [Armatimonadota bacterium]